MTPPPRPDVIYAAEPDKERQRLQWAGFAIANALKLLSEEIKIADIQISGGRRHA